MTYTEWIRRHRRTIGIPLVISAIWLAHFDRQYFWVSLLVVGLGEVLRIWSAGHLHKDDVLTTGGPYSRIRNPLYVGSFLIAIGFCLIAGSIWVWILVAAYFLLCYLPVIQSEERLLAEKFPEEYSRYATAVPALYPGWKRYDQPSSKFSLRQVVRNKEYNAVIGIVLAYLVLLFFR